jgi:C4-dicarboxylate transporter DctQ subunit
LRIFFRLEKGLVRMEDAIALFGFVVLFVTVNIQVFQRYFNLPIVDTSEISLTSQTSFAFICMGALVYYRGHITIEVTKLIRKKELLFAVDLIMYFFLCVFACVFLWLGWSLMIFALESGTATTSLRIPLWIPYGSMMLGLAAVLIHSVGGAARLIFARRIRLASGGEGVPAPVETGAKAEAPAADAGKAG